MFDDRLATVLRTRAESVAGQRTQFRQLLDLLGTARTDENRSATIDAAYSRLADLSTTISANDQSHILRETGLRIRNPRLVAFLAQAEPKPAASAMATARLSEQEWVALIPALPVTARGFLRHRRDLPPGAVEVLKRLGVGDLTLSDSRPRPATPVEPVAPVEPADPVEPVAKPAPAPPPAPAPAPPIAPVDDAPAAQTQTRPQTQPQTPPPTQPEPVVKRASLPPGYAAAASIIAPSASTEPAPISQIIERIEQYRVGRRAPVLAPRLPLGDTDAADAPARIVSFDVVTDAAGRAVSASDTVAPWITGMLLTAPQPGQLVLLSDETATALRQHQPIVNARLRISGAHQVSGEWRLDATPVFDEARGAFAGYRCRLRRPVMAAALASTEDSHADKMRQILHELRTPVGAIQGFAEIIQQQMFGPAPHEYRAHAASISVDAARLLAGFDEIDRLARLESNAQLLAYGETDFGSVISDTLRRLDGVLRPRQAGFDLTVAGNRFTIAMTLADAQQMAWRLLATVAGALGPGEKIALKLDATGAQLRLISDLPAPLQVADHGAERLPARRPVVSAGMFGPQFSLRLAGAEAKAAGGALLIEGDRLMVTLPLLTSAARPHNAAPERAQG